MRVWRYRIRLVATIVVVGVAAALISLRLPRPIEAVGTLDQCYLDRWPALILEGEDWRTAIPIADEYRAYAPRQMPVAAWPSGMRFDYETSAVLDIDGNVLFRKGDRVRVKGSVIGTDGDPAPCYYTIGLSVTEVSSP